MDVSHASGTELRIRVRPPLGFWALNSFAVDYDSEAALEVRRVPPNFATTSAGRSVLPELLSADERYYEMPETTDSADLRFQAPPARPGLKRTIILHSRGWYQLHLKTDAEPDTTLLEQIRTAPEGAARFAAEEWSNWKATQRPPE